MDWDSSCNGEAWSSHICPKCRNWARLAEYDVVSVAKVAGK